MDNERKIKSWVIVYEFSDNEVIIIIFFYLYYNKRIYY